MSTSVASVKPDSVHAGNAQLNRALIKSNGGMELLLSFVRSEEEAAATTSHAIAALINVLAGGHEADKLAFCGSPALEQLVGFSDSKPPILSLCLQNDVLTMLVHKKCRRRRARG